jgi:acetyl coenzyme A synthetase (ADP forming)-like protein
MTGVDEVVSTVEASTRTADRRRAGMRAVFRPRSIAVIGASRTRGTIGGEIFHNLMERGFSGPVYPVNPKSEVVQSVRAYPDVASIPGDVDLAVIVVPALHVNAALEACGEKGVQAAIVISAGFKEIGEEGAARERVLRETAERYGMRLVGPNCLGVLNNEPEVSMNALFAPTNPPAGKVAFSSQSGALGLAILEYAASLNLGISQFISVGNKADISGNDLLEFWEDDPGTKVILLYLESFGNPRRFAQVAGRVARKKPIIAVKSGRTAAGVRAASSHTGSLAGPDLAVDALCRQSGVIRTDTIEELFDVAILLANQPVPRGHRVGIVTNSGGPAIMASDACESHGLLVPLLEDATVEALRAFLPREASTRNPVDMIASAVPETFERAVALVLADPNIDSLLAIYVPPMSKTPLDVAQAIVQGAATANARFEERGLPAKPVLSCFMGAHGVPEGLRSLQESHVPSYMFPESAAIALARAVAYGRWLERPAGAVVHVDDIDASRAAAALAPPPRPLVETAAGRADAAKPRWLGAHATRELLEAYGIRTPETVLARSEREAVEAATRVGFPVVMKLASETITHKSDVGGVQLDLRTEAEARDAYRQIAARLKAAGRASEMTGVIVQPMLKGGVEAIVGVSHDPTFGWLVMFGLGGVYVEVLKDVAFRIHPLTDIDAHELVREVRGFPLLQGYRGAPPGDIACLERTLLRVSQLLEEHPEIVEMDLNPLKVMPPGHGCLAVDARIAVRAGG